MAFLGASAIVNTQGAIVTMLKFVRAQIHTKTTSAQDLTKKTYEIENQHELYGAWVS